MTDHHDPMASARPDHTPVMMAEVLAALSLTPGDLVVDATFGRGGYSREFLSATDCTVIGLDRDPEAVAHGRRMAADWAGRLSVIETRFGDMEAAVASAAGGQDRPGVDAVVMDLGVSSPQLDTAERGFSFRRDGPLDMRMGASGPTAADVVNTLDEDDLTAIFRELGEERHGRRVAQEIVALRRDKPLRTTADLGNIVRSVVRKSRDGIDPATRTFQGLRLYVNDELGELDRGLVAAERMLRPGGRLVVVSFHSLEDRRVKRFLAERSGRRSGGSRHMPDSADAGIARKPSFTLITRKAARPTEDECRANPRARSARLRAAVRTDAAPYDDTPGKNGPDRNAPDRNAGEAA